jgi:hypothetical protein
MPPFPEGRIIMANTNQVIVNGKTILDLRSDTVTPKTLQKGITTHDKSGAKITGTLIVPGQETRNVDLNMQSGNQDIVSSTGMLMKQVTVIKPGTFLPENIKKGVNIGGVIGTLEASPSGGGSTGETWVLNNEVGSLDSGGETINVNFTSNGLSFSSIGISINLRRQILYGSTVVRAFDAWTSQAYRKLTFDASPTGDLLTWLQANGVKQANDTAVQPSKNVSITANGTTEVTPDVPYDALKEVSVQTNVPGSPGFSVTFPSTVDNPEGGFTTPSMYLYKADGTTTQVFSASGTEYSNIAGKTIEGVIGIYYDNTSKFHKLKLTLTGSVYVTSLSMGVGITTNGVTPATFATPSVPTLFLFLSDSTITNMEIHNTD